MNRRYKIIITGKVQGVNFRSNAYNEAKLLNVRGYIQNKADGSIYVEAEGAGENLKKFIEWCKIGPEGAIVDDMEINEGPARNLVDFKIKY